MMKRIRQMTALAPFSAIDQIASSPLASRPRKKTLDPSREKRRTGLYVAQAHYPSDNRRGVALAAEALAAAARTGDDGLLAGAHTTVAMNASMRGDFRTALENCREIERVHDPAHAPGWLAAFMDPGPTAQCLIGEALCMLGYPDQALDRAASSVRLADQAPSTGTLLLMRWYEIMVLLWRRDYRALFERSRALADAVDARGLNAHCGPLARIPLGWSQAHMGDVDESIAVVKTAHGEWVATGWAAGTCYFTALYAQALRLGGRAREGLDLLDHSIATSPRSSSTRRWTTSVRASGRRP